MNRVVLSLIIRGFLIIITHLQAIEIQLGMAHAAEALDKERVMFRGYLDDM